MLTFIRTPLAFDVDPGGGGGAPPAAPMSPSEAANARIEQAVANGLTDDGDGVNGPDRTPTAASGDPAVPAAAPAPGSLDGLEVPDNLAYRDGVKLREQITEFKGRYKPFEEAFGGLEEADRSAAVDALRGLGTDAAPVIGIVAGMHPNDRAMLLNAYAEFSTDPVKGAEAFRVIAEQAAKAAGINPAVGNGTSPPPVPDPAAGALGDDDLDRPITRRELEQRESERAAAADTARAQEQAQSQILTDARALGYDPESTDPAERTRADHLIWLAGFRTEGDLKAAHAVLEGERQAVIDGYLKDKRANASRPAAPETGTAPSGQTEPNTPVDPMERARNRLDAELGPDLFARR